MPTGYDPADIGPHIGRTYVTRGSRYSIADDGILLVASNTSSCGLRLAGQQARILAGIPESANQDVYRDMDAFKRQYEADFLKRIRGEAVTIGREELLQAWQTADRSPLNRQLEEVAIRYGQEPSEGLGLLIATSPGCRRGYNWTITTPVERI